jgi:hypothetical protein
MGLLASTKLRVAELFEAASAADSTTIACTARVIADFEDSSTMAMLQSSAIIAMQAVGSMAITLAMWRNCFGLLPSELAALFKRFRRLEDSVLKYSSKHY